MFRPVKHIQINSWIWALEQLDTRDNHVTLVRRCVVLWILPDQWIVGWKYLLSLLCLLKVMRKAALNHVSLSFLSWFNYNLWLSYCVSPSTPLCFFSFPVVGVDYAVSHTAVHFTAERRDSFSVLQRTRLDGIVLWQWPCWLLISNNADSWYIIINLHIYCKSCSLLK